MEKLLFAPCIERSPLRITGTYNTTDFIQKEVDRIPLEEWALFSPNRYKQEGLGRTNSATFPA
jgi:hypothetical protein